MGQACSMGSLLAQAGAPGKRYMLPYARHMIHQPSGGAQGQATDIQIQAQEILKMKKYLTEIYVKHNTAGKTFEQLTQDMERNWKPLHELHETYTLLVPLLGTIMVSKQSQEHWVWIAYNDNPMLQQSGVCAHLVDAKRESVLALVHMYCRTHVRTDTDTERQHAH